MGKIHVIVQAGGKHGLDIAVDYYKEFPVEPSPAGEMDLSDAKFVKINNIDFDKLLVEMAKAPSGGTVLIVCHAHADYNPDSTLTSLLMPLAAGANISAQDATIKMLLDMLPDYAKSKDVSKLSAGSAADLKLRSASSLKSLLDHVEAVRSLKLERVEFRACKIGHDETALKNLKELFGCKKLLAPTARTFYLDHMPIDNLDRFDHRYVGEHRGGKFLPAGTTGRSIRNPVDFMSDVIRKDPKTRIFWDVEYHDIPPANPGPIPGVRDSGGVSIKLKGEVLAMIVEEVAPSWYRGSAGTWHETSAHKPLPDDAGKFVHQYVMARAKYSSGNIMVAGFWTPDNDLFPWLLPNDGEYIDYIKQV